MAAPDARKLGLEIDEDCRFQARLWVAERIAWALMGAVVIVALLGFTGRGGPFAQVTAQAPEGSVEHPRVTRWTAPDQIVVVFDGAGEEGVLEIDRSFFEVFAVTGIQPQPKTSFATPEGQTLIFGLAPEAGRRSVRLQVRSERPAIPLRTRMRIDDGTPISLSPIVLP